MGTTDKNGVYKYDTSDTVASWPTFMNLGMNSVSNALSIGVPKYVYTASSQSDANTKATAIKNNGFTPSSSAPFFFYRTDQKMMYAYDGTSWTAIGTQNAISGATANVLVQSGSWKFTGNLARNASTGAHSITFPTAYASAPSVTASPSNARVSCETKNITTTGFSTNMKNNSDGATVDGSLTVTWIAVGVKA